jgi:hypothetical protein
LERYEYELRTVRSFEVLRGESYSEKLFESEWKDVVAVKIGPLWFEICSQVDINQCCLESYSFSR